MPYFPVGWRAAEPSAQNPFAGRPKMTRDPSSCFDLKATRIPEVEEIVALRPTVVQQNLRIWVGKQGKLQNPKSRKTSRSKLQGTELSYGQIICNRSALALEMPGWKSRYIGTGKMPALRRWRNKVLNSYDHIECGGNPEGFRGLEFEAFLSVGVWSLKSFLEFLTPNS